MSDDLRVNDFEVIVHSLVENHVVNNLIQMVTFGPQPVYAIDIDVLKELIYLGMRVDFLDELPQELNHLLILVVNTEEEAVEQSDWLLLNEVFVLLDTFDDILVELSSGIAIILLCKSIGFLKPVSDLVMEVDFFHAFLHHSFLDTDTLNLHSVLLDLDVLVVACLVNYLVRLVRVLINTFNINKRLH